MTTQTHPAANTNNSAALAFYLDMATELLTASMHKMAGQILLGGVCSHGRLGLINAMHDAVQQRAEADTDEAPHYQQALLPNVKRLQVFARNTWRPA